MTQIELENAHLLRHALREYISSKENKAKNCTNDIWEQRRYEVAKDYVMVMAMHNCGSDSDIIKDAVLIANELIKELKANENEH